MNIAPRFFGKIQNGKTIIEPLIKKKMEDYISSLEGRNVEIIIKRRVLNRSLQANAYLWGVVYSIISDDTGNSIEDLHLFFKGKFLSKEIVIKNKPRIITGNSAVLNTSDFGQYIENIVRWAAENDIVIPEPNAVEI